MEIRSPLYLLTTTNLLPSKYELERARLQNFQFDDENSDSFYENMEDFLEDESVV